jgi:hypothetical protein
MKIVIGSTDKMIINACMFLDDWPEKKRTNASEKTIKLILLIKKHNTPTINIFLRNILAFSLD